MKNNSKINRRNAIKTMALGTTAMAIPNINSEINSTLTPLKGNINHSVCQWCFGNTPIETLAQEAKKI